MFEAFLSNPTPVVGALLLAAIGSWLHYHNAFLARRALAAAAFRAAFAPDLAAIEANSFGDRDLMDYLGVAYTERHAQAALVFEPFLSRRRRRSFVADWNRYRYGEQKDGSPLSPEKAATTEVGLRFLQYSDEWHGFKAELAHDLAIKHIHILLSHASET